MGLVTAALNQGFAAELMRTVFVTQQYIANLPRDATQPKDEQALAWARDAVPVVVGVDRGKRPQRGLHLAGSWLGGAVSRPQTVWLAVPGELRDPSAVAAQLTGALGRLLGEAAATAGSFTGGEGPLPEAYEMAMQVIASEWHVGSGMRGAIPPKHDPQAVELFAGVRENRFVTQSDKALRPAEQLLSDPRVAATFLYRMAQDKKLMKAIGPDAFYAPLANDRIPPGVSPAAVLGAFRNLQMKLLGSWVEAVRRGKRPGHIADLVEIYSQQFPAEREQVLGLFLATTLGGTVKPGGITQNGPEQSLKELKDLLAELIAGKKTLTDALNQGHESQ